MKDPGDYIPGGVLEVCGDWYDDLLKCISEVQKEAYNKAIEDAMNNVSLNIPTNDWQQRWVNKESILKLKIK